MVEDPWSACVVTFQKNKKDGKLAVDDDFSLVLFYRITRFFVVDMFFLVSEQIGTNIR